MQSSAIKSSSCMRTELGRHLVRSLSLAFISIFWGLSFLASCGGAHCRCYPAAAAAAATAALLREIARDCLRFFRDARACERLCGCRQVDAFAPRVNSCCTLHSRRTLPTAPLLTTAHQTLRRRPRRRARDGYTTVTCGYVAVTRCTRHLLCPCPRRRLAMDVPRVRLLRRDHAVTARGRRTPIGQRGAVDPAWQRSCPLD